MRAFDVVTYFDDRGIAYKTSGKNVSRGWINIQCCFCDDHSTHLGINLDTKNFHCWICGTKGTAVKLVKYLEDTSWYQARNVVDEFTDWTQASLDEKFKPSPPKKLFPANFAEISPDNIPIPVHSYLLKRNFNPTQEATKRQLYWPGNAGDYAFRLIVPVIVNNQIVNFMGRDVTDKLSFRHKSCPNEIAAIPLNNTLYEIDSLPEGCPVIIVEGFFDQWRFGFGSVAQWGSSLTDAQAELLRVKKPPIIYIVPDPDEGQKGVEKSIKKLWFAPVEICELSSDKDPGELSWKEAEMVMKEILNG